MQIKGTFDKKTTMRQWIRCKRQLHSLFPIFNFVKYHHRTMSRDILKRIPIANKISDAYILTQWMNIALLKWSICIGTMKQNDFILHFVQNNLRLNWTKKTFSKKKSKFQTLHNFSECEVQVQKCKYEQYFL